MSELQGKSVQIIMSDHGIGEVYIDGVQVHRVVSVRFESRAREINRLLLEFIPQQVSIEGPVIRCDWKDTD